MLFDVNVNTQLHRTMRHICDQIVSFGMLRWGENDDIETLHTHINAAYRGTNKRLTQLSGQLLAARTEAKVEDDGEKQNRKEEEETL